MHLSERQLEPLSWSVFLSFSLVNKRVTQHLCGCSFSGLIFTVWITSMTVVLRKPINLVFQAKTYRSCIFHLFIFIVCISIFPFISWTLFNFFQSCLCIFYLFSATSESANRFFSCFIIWPFWYVLYTYHNYTVSVQFILGLMFHHPDLNFLSLNHMFLTP